MRTIFSICLNVLIFFLVVWLISQPVFAATLAVVDFHNDSGRKDLEYLNHSIPTTLIMDLTKTDQIDVVERKEIDRVIGEQRKSVDDLFDRSAERELGKLLGADYFLSGSFTELKSTFSSRVRVDLNMVSVDTGKKISFSQTGKDENVVHRLSESVVKYLIGKDIPRQVESPQNLVPEVAWYKRWYVWAVVGGIIAVVAVSASPSGGAGGQGGSSGGSGGL